MVGFRKRTRSARRRPLLSQAGKAGPRRLLLLTLAGTSLVALGAVALTRSINALPLSADVRRRSIDPLPGGFLSSPEQEAVAFHADTKAAEKALREGRSSTPPLAASIRLVNGQPAVDPDPPRPATGHALPPPPRPVISTAAPPPVYAPATVIPAVLRAPQTPDPAPAPPKPPVVQAQYQGSQRNDAQQRTYDQQMKDLLEQWNARPPQTDVILPPPERRTDGPADQSGQAPAVAGRAPELPGIQSVSNRPDTGGEILVPAGHGIYAHPILKLSSDTGGPVVLQADTGRLAGDRLIGSFSQQGNRLVIKIDNVIHRGEPISASGFVVAPATMEAGVASDVDQNLVSRFILPAAAAFVQGLGSAIATTSNTASVLSPLGGVTTSTNLNLNQQLGIAAGVAASNIGSTLNAAAPRGPTVTLDAGVTVGVMFLSNVVSRGAR